MPEFGKWSCSPTQAIDVEFAIFIDTCKSAQVQSTIIAREPTAQCSEQQLDGTNQCQSDS
jgi:hypothetical protein